jgi:endonuclease VIII
MPEGDMIYRAARTLHGALAGRTVTEFETVLPALARVDVDQGVVGRSIERVEAKGKWTLMHFSQDLILLTHMLMSGSWHIYRPGEQWQSSRSDMRIAIHTAEILAVGFRIPVAEFHSSDSLRRRTGFSNLGPALLTGKFDENVAIQRLSSRPDLEVGVALVTQSLIAGIGNIFKSEVCFASNVNPFRKIGSLHPDELRRLVSVAQKFLKANVLTHSGDGITTHHNLRTATPNIDQADRVWVYQRKDQPCRKCGTPINAWKQGPMAQTTYWCPQCQPLGETARCANS